LFHQGELIGGDFGKGLPLGIFGVMSVLAGLLCLFLPETLNQKLPDTAQEAANFKGWVYTVDMVPHPFLISRGRFTLFTWYHILS